MRIPVLVSMFFSVFPCDIRALCPKSEKIDKNIWFYGQQVFLTNFFKILRYNQNLQLCGTDFNAAQGKL